MGTHLPVLLQSEQQDQYMSDFHNDIENCLDVLQRGGIILYPTDTIWGIGCDGTNPDAVKKIFGLKKRSGARGMIILLADVSDLGRYTSETNPGIYHFLKGCTIPITVIYPGGKDLAANIKHADGTVAIRIVDEPFCQALIKGFHKPIVSTSANISGEPTPGYYEQISKPIIKGVDYIVRYRQGDKNPGKPSSIVKCNTDGTVTLVRT